MEKFEVANHLAKRFNLKRYLEICTPSTGCTFAQAIENGACARYDRLLYRCPESFDDGAPVTYRTAQPSSHELIRNLRAAFDQRPVYDIVFVDPWHSLTCSEEDLAGAWQLLRPGGVMVVHDCNPPAAEVAQPDPPGPGGAWCGVTYQAFIEFLMSGLASDACTVDSDYGVGVAFKGDGQAQSEVIERVRAHGPAWRLARNDSTERFAYFLTHRTSLLNLISPQDFQERFRNSSTSDLEAPDVAAQLELGTRPAASL